MIDQQGYCSECGLHAQSVAESLGELDRCGKEIADKDAEIERLNRTLKPLQSEVDKWRNADTMNPAMVILVSDWEKKDAEIERLAERLEFTKKSWKAECQAEQTRAGKAETALAARDGQLAEAKERFKRLTKSVEKTDDVDYRIHDPADDFPSGWTPRGLIEEEFNRLEREAAEANKSGEVRGDVHSA